MQACVKLAWDFVVPSNLPLYIQSWRLVASRVTCGDNRPDYMGVMALLFVFVQELKQAGKI